MAGAIVLLATVAILLQNQQYGLAAGWAVIHGAGLSAATALLPAATACALLWAGYFYARRRNSRRATAVFVGGAVVILLVNEAFLPGTPMKTWISERAIAAVEVRNVRDDVFRSLRGNPIGIRITFDAVFPQTGPYGLSASAMAPVGPVLSSAMLFELSMRLAVDPTPAVEADSPYSIFRKDVVYHFTQEMTPNFLFYDDKTKELCLTSYVSEVDVESALPKSRNVAYRTSIQVDRPFGRRGVVQEYVTTRGYDLGAMRESIAVEGNKRCGP